MQYLLRRCNFISTRVAWVSTISLHLKTSWEIEFTGIRTVRVLDRLRKKFYARLQTFSNCSLSYFFSPNFIYVHFAMHTLFIAFDISILHHSLDSTPIFSQPKTSDTAAFWCSRYCKVKKFESHHLMTLLHLPERKWVTCVENFRN